MGRDVSQNYLIGVGIADITGEAGGVGMMGMARAQQITKGIHNRQWARAFVIGDNTDNNSGKRILFVNTDLGQLFESVYHEVIRRLGEQFGDRYTDQNTVISATHTHSGPGGSAHAVLYNLTIGGFRPDTFEAIVAGIVEACVRADADLAPGDISIAVGELHGASVSRNLFQFECNPEDEQKLFPTANDPQMTQLKFERDGKAVAGLNWFSVHGTSMTNRNTLISADNKGYASYLWEHDWAGQASVAKAQGEYNFVAAFAQSSAGDMSPNVGAGTAYGPTDDMFENTRVIGSRQAVKAKELLDSATEELRGPVDYRQRYVDFSHVDVAAKWTPNGKDTRTWPAVLGQAFMAGCYDGAGVPFVKQGQMDRVAILKLLDHTMVKVPDHVAAGHSPKPIGIATGLMSPPWTSQIISIQVLRVGQLAIVVVPAEFTIVAAHRARAAVQEALAGQVSHVVLAGYANDYTGYVVTPEEYMIQRYESASTHFGPATLPAYQQELAALAGAIADGTPTPSMAAPPDLSESRFSTSSTLAMPVAILANSKLNASIIHRADTQLNPDNTKANQRFGELLTTPHASYTTGDEVVAQFVGAHPNNDQRRGSTFLEVQRKSGNDWSTILTDDDWSTKFEWKQKPNHRSVVTVRWVVTGDVAPGMYRVRYLGDALTADGSTKPIVGTSKEFSVR